VQRPTTGTDSYTLTAQALHWLTVLLILMILPVAWVMMSLPKGPEQDWMMVFHRSLGVTIFAVAVLRLAWRSTHPAPPSLSGVPRVTELISEVTHWLLYALLLLMPITGYLQSADDRPVSCFGLFNFQSCRGTSRWVMLPKLFIWLASGLNMRWSASTWRQPSGT
jgi:cytochrome b561